MGDVIWKPIIDSNKKVNFTEKHYYNFFMMNRGEVTDQVLFNQTVKVESRFDLVS